MDLHDLIWRAGIEPEHYDGMGRRIQPSWATVREIVKSLGLDADSPEELSSMLEDYRREKRERFLDPVVVKWEGRDAAVQVHIDPGRGDSPAIFTARSEQGEEFLFRQVLQEEEGRVYSFCCPDGLPPGYYDVEVEAGGKRGETLLIVAPDRAFAGREAKRSWGLFCPLYALHSTGSLGSGDFTDLEAFISWMSGKGGRILGTLPLFAASLDDPCEPSPYAPLSRLFWNEFYADPRRALNWERCRAARELYESESFRLSLDKLNMSYRVDFRAGMKLRRSLLELLARDFFNGSSPDIRPGWRIMEEFLEVEPEVLRYARFRAGRDHERVQSRDRSSWSGPECGKDVDQELVEYHLYAQWLASVQVDSLREQAAGRGVELYMDLPLGVHPDGYDAWAYRDVFARGVSGGAPPDAFFTAGQDWGFRPMHPWNSRDAGHAYFRRIVSRLMHFSNVIRLDHVMSLHRLYWVPLGFPADQGAYVRYPWEELYAILLLESHRNQCVIVGEDLGTVPPEVRQSMEEKGVLRMFVGQFEIDPWNGTGVHNPAGQMVASVNTHDTPTFAGFARGLDIMDRVELGILKEEGVPAEFEGRNRILQVLADTLGISFPGIGPEWDGILPEVLKRWLLKLAASRARYLILNLEDLWLDENPQNVPGTTCQKPNWKRKMRASFEEFSRDSLIGELLGEIDRVRNGGG